LGNGCAGLNFRIPIGCQLLPFTVFAGSLPFFDTGATPLSGATIFPRMTQILPINYKRVGLVLYRSFVGGYLATIGNGQGVSVQQCLGNNVNNPSTFNIFLRAGDPEAFIVDPWYAIVADAVPPQDHQIVFAGAEVVKVS